LFQPAECSKTRCMSSIIGPICLHLNDIFFNHADTFSYSNPLQGYLPVLLRSLATY
jgi:hypothetical protein